MEKRIDVRRVPLKFYEELEAEGAPRRESVPQTLLRLAYERLHGGNLTAGDGKEATKRGKKAAETPHFEKPTKVQWVSYWISQGGGQADGERAYDWCLQNGWKLSNGNPMRDWQATARNSIARNKQRGEGKRPNPFGEIPPPLRDAAKVREDQIAAAKAAELAEYGPEPEEE